MPILTYATGISQLIKGQSSADDSTAYKVNYVKESIRGSLLTVEEDRILTFADTLPDTFYLSFGANTTSAVGLSDFLTIGDGTTDLLRFRVGGDGQIIMYWYNGTSEEEVFDTDDYTDVEPASNTIRFDIEYHYGGSGSGHIDVYAANTLLVSYDADTSASGVSATQAYFGYYQYNTFETNQNFISGMFIADEVSRYITMYQLVLSEDGEFHTDFNGSYEYLNNLGETGDLQSVTATELGDKQTYKIDSSPFSGVSGGTVVGVGVHARGKVQESLQGDQVRIMASTSTDDEYSEYFTMEERIEPFQTIFDNAPDGSSWQLDNIDNWEFGFEVTASD